MEKVLKEIELLRQEMIESYRAEDIDAAVKISQLLDGKINDYILRSQHKLSAKTILGDWWNKKIKAFKALIFFLTESDDISIEANDLT